MAFKTEKNKETKDYDKKPNNDDSLMHKWQHNEQRLLVVVEAVAIALVEVAEQLLLGVAVKLVELRLHLAISNYTTLCS
jgi:hypothetical protein